MTNRKSLILLAFICAGCSSPSNQQKSSSLLRVEESSPIVSQSAEQKFYYKLFKPDTLNDFSLTNFNITEAYQYGNLKLLFGFYSGAAEPISKHEAKNDLGKRLIVLDKNNKQLFRSHGQMDSYILRPAFYKLNQRSPILILAEIGTEYSWGNLVFSIEKNKVKYLGTIELAGINKERNDYDNIGGFTKISKNGKNLEFRFPTDSVVFDPGGRDEKTIAGNQIYYSYNGKEFKCIR